MADDLILRPARADEFEYVFALHKDGLGPYIRRAWGWDEEEQRRDLEERFAQIPFEIAESGERALGMISLAAETDHLYLHHIILARESRNRGFGMALMRILLARAAARGVPLRLSVFRENPARALYLRLGFRVTGGDEHLERMQAP